MSGLGDDGPGFPDRGPAVFAVATATLVLASVFVVSRMICRIGIVKNLSWDDYIIMLAWLFAFFLSFVIDLGTYKGLGRHDTNINSADKPILRKCEYVFTVLYNPALMATKTSILVFYLRLAKNTQKILRLASWLVLFIVNVSGTILTFMNIFQCRPVEAAWDVNADSIQCVPLLTEFIVSAPVNIVTDLAILALPLPVLTGMRLPPRQKTILVITFAVGIFVAVVDVVRIYYLQQAITSVPISTSSETSAIFGATPEFSWNASLSLMWSAVEVNVGIACACIPTLKPLIVRILPAMLMDPNGPRRNSDTRDSHFVSTNASSKRGSSDGSHAPTNATESHQTSPRHPPAARVQGNSASEEISFIDFLRGADPDAAGHQGQGHQEPERNRRRSQMINRMSTFTAATRQDDAVYFGFVNLKRPKSMLKSSVKESMGYCAVVTILFLLWGFSYGLLNTLNNAVATVSGMTVAETLGLTSAYFGGGYFFGPLLVGEWILRHDEHRRLRRRRPGQPDSVGGFKITFIVGLLIYGTGTIIFWPSAVLTSFPGFLISNFVVGFGLGVLETAANPFLALCGPANYAEARLLFAQGIQAVGSVLSGVLAENVFFGSIHSQTAETSTTLIDVQWTYLAITLLCVLLALFFYYMPLPEVSDRELARASSKLPVNPEKRSIGGVSLRTWCIILAVAAQWTYVAAQECTSIFFHNLILAYATSHVDKPPSFTLSAPHYLFIAHTAFAISRFAAALLAYLHVQHPKCRFIPDPRTILLTSTALCVVCMILAVTLRPMSNPNLLAVPLILFFLAEGPLWPLIFAMGLRGQGKRTKRAAAWLTMGGSGPAFWPFVQLAILQRGGSIQTAFVVVIALLAVSLAYPLFLTFVRDARAMVDSSHARVEGIAEGREGGGVRARTRSRSVSTATEMDINQILAARRRSSVRSVSSAAAGDDGKASWMAKLATAIRRVSTFGSTVEPAVEQHEERTPPPPTQEAEMGRGPAEREENGGRDRAEERTEEEEEDSDAETAREPWEEQVLDTRMLRD